MGNRLARNATKGVVNRNGRTYNVGQYASTKNAMKGGAGGGG